MHPGLGDVWDWRESGYALLSRWHFEIAYRTARRREKCSRNDFRSGWDAAWLVIADWLSDPEGEDSDEHQRSEGGSDQTPEGNGCRAA